MTKRIDFSSRPALWTAIAATALLTACGGGGSDNEGPDAPAGFNVGYGVKGYQFSWNASANAARYELWEDPDGSAGPKPEVQIGGALTQTDYALTLNGQLLTERVNASYRVRACDTDGCGAYSAALTPDLTQAIGYFKASNSDKADTFGISIALSADGSTMAVGASEEDSKATGVNGDQADNTNANAGAVYLFARTSSGWSQQAYLKASNTKIVANSSGATLRTGFGASLSLSTNGDTLAVGAPDEASNARGINGDQTNTQTPGAGAVYVFQRSSGTWHQQAYVKASNTAAQVTWNQTIGYGSYPSLPANFGSSVSLSGDGSWLAVGAPGETSLATGINGDQNDASTSRIGAVYVFKQQIEGTPWAQDAYIKPDTLPTFFGYLSFGQQVAFAAQSPTLAVAGADGVRIFGTDGITWSQRGKIRGSNTEDADFFGNQLALSADGNTLAIGAFNESASGTGVNQPPGIRSLVRAGAAYVFTQSGGAWSQQAYIKPSNTQQDARFGASLAISADGRTLAVGASAEASSGKGLGGNPSDMAAGGAGAVYLFQSTSGAWAQRSYIKASNTDARDLFGTSLALSADGHTLAVGAPGEDSLSTGIQGNQTDNSGMPEFPAPGTEWSAGAVYLY